MHTMRGEGGSAFGGSALKARPAPCLLHDHHDRGGRRVTGTGSRRTVWTMPCRPSGGGKGEQQSPEFRLHANGQDVVSLAFLHERPLASVRPPPPQPHSFISMPPSFLTFTSLPAGHCLWCACVLGLGGALGPWRRGCASWSRPRVPPPGLLLRGAAMARSCTAHTNGEDCQRLPLSAVVAVLGGAMHAARADFVKVDWRTCGWK